MKRPAFKNQDLELAALTHKSYANENRLSYNNEKLEFIGDAVLDLIIGEMLFLEFPEDHEGRLSKKRASLVNEETLAEKALQLSLQNELRLGRGEASRSRLLASVLESLIGGLYLDQGFDVVRGWVTELFLQDVKKLGFTSIDYEKDYKSRLQEVLQKAYKQTPLYEVVSEEGLSHEKIFTVQLSFQDKKIALGRGTTKKIAEQEAAKGALQNLEAQIPSMGEKSE
ncbi:MAG: ribonuclease III [Pseudobdellovibrionaceae bacterium]